MFEKSNPSLLLSPIDMDLSTEEYHVPPVGVASSRGRHSQSKQGIKSSYLVFAFLFIVLTGLNAAPWIRESAVWLGVLGIVLTLELTKRMGAVSGLLATWLSCIGSVGIAFHWSPGAMSYTLSSSFGVGLLVALPLVVWDALRMSLGYWIAARFTTDIRIQWLAAASMTVLFEYIMPGVFPWKIGYVLLPIPWTIQAVDIFGSSYSTIVAFAFAGAIQLCAYTLWRRIHNDKTTPSATPVLNNKWGLASIFLTPAVIVLTINFIYSGVAWNIWQRECQVAPKIRIGLIQVDPSFKESPQRLQQFTQSMSEDVDLICWPESSGGNYELQLDNLSDPDRIFQMSRSPSRGMRPWPSPKCELLLAGKNYVGDPSAPDQLYVTAMLIDRKESIVGRYNKRFLMPFGEYVPGKDYVPGLEALFDMDEQIHPGCTNGSLASDTGARIGTLICYEDMVPRASIEAVDQGANVLIALVNGSAFESKFTLFQHRLLAQLRALENRRYLARCASTGETCIINPLGEMESRIPLQTHGVLVGNVALIERRSIYSRFPWILPLSGLGLFVFALIQGRRQRWFRWD